MSINVIKRGGKIVPYNPERINTFLEFVCDGLDNVSVSEIALNSGLMIHDGISTSDINKALLESAHNLISEDTPDYAIVAGRILVCDIRKEVYGDFEPVDLLSIIKDNTALGWYDSQILEKFSEEEISELNDYIDHDRDLMYSISGMREWESKYLIKNASTGQKFESPQVSYMLVSMMYFIDDNGDGVTDRIGFIKEMYDLLSLGYWNIPTPHLARLRTPTKAFSSCVLLPVGDDIDSISEASVAARKYATLGAGLGVDVSRLRSRNAPIRGGVAINTGALYHSKSIEEAALSCSQGQTRKGSLTFNWWGLHKDIEEILTYKNNMKKDSEAMKHSDHTIFINGFILDAVRNNQELHCFDPNDVPELYKSFYSDDDEWFLREYKKAVESDLPRSIINARTYWDSLISERFNTGRVYIAFADNINRQSMYKNDKYQITQSNLCVAPETLILTKDGYLPISSLENQDVEVWNGEEWSSVKIIKTGTNQPLITVKLLNGKSIDCTPYHKFYVYDKTGAINEVRAKDLKDGDQLISYNLPNIELEQIVEDDIVHYIEDKGRIDDIYCANEPKRHMIMFNGILTGNCLEITLPTEPIRKVYNPEAETYTQEGLIALCNLGGVNFGAVDKPEDLLRIVKVGHRALDNLLSYQEHPFPAARRHNELFRPLGIGITGLAYWMARHDLNYSNCYHELDKWMQYFSYAAIDASVELAKERGKCLGYEDTKWSEGKLPMDMVNDYYEKFMPHVDHVDWDSLRAKLSKYGIRNASLLAMFPAETSAKVSGSGTTNGIEPIRELLIAKGGKNKRAIFVVPELKRLKNKYDRVWDNLDNTSLIKTYGVIQKYTDQAISCNTYYNKSNYPSGKIPNEIINYDIFLHKALGGKTLYYNNNYDGQSQSFMDGKDIISGGDVTIVTSSDEDDCESCKL
nr:MAG TPA: ribonucleoside-diphosphate reductase subunit alpha [Caudoviricetes sp.]